MFLYFSYFPNYTCHTYCRLYVLDKSLVFVLVPLRTYSLIDLKKRPSSFRKPLELRVLTIGDTESNFFPFRPNDPRSPFRQRHRVDTLRF